MRGIKNTINILKKQYKKPSCARCLRLGWRKEINYSASIRQALYEYCIDYYMDIDADEKVMELMKAYPELEAVYIKRVEEKMVHVVFPEETPEQAEARWQKLCARIREEFGEDVI